MNTFAFAMLTPHTSIQFEQRVEDYITLHRLISREQPVLVALSGGADSVALLRVLMALGYRCKAAHCNFHLRGDESDRDERFVRELCAGLGVPLYVRSFDVTTYINEKGVSLEMACRELRYAWFDDLLKEQGCERLAVAHHLNDNVETFFLNALRGTGIKGLSGIPVKNGAVVRPLLCVKRADVMNYLDSLRQAYVTDSTNKVNDVKRNKFRNIILPQIERYFPDADTQFGKTISHVNSCNALYSELVKQAKNDVCNFKGGMLSIDISKLLRFKNVITLLFEVLRPYGFNYSQCSDVMRTIGEKVEVGKHFYSSSYTLSVQRTMLEVYVHQPTLETSYDINLNNSELSCPIKIDIKIVEKVKNSLQNCDGRCVIALNLDVQNVKNIVIRHWRTGDRFRPFGMNGSKLLSDLFTDMKLSEREKNEVWLMEADGEILWVIGCRASALYKVGADDKRYLMLSVSK